LFWYNDTQLPYTIEISPTLAEDARALLNGNATYILRNEKPLVDINARDGIDQRDHIALTLQDTNPAIVACLGGGQHLTQYVSLAQPRHQPQVPAAPIVAPVNSQVNHVAITAIPQCPYGCPGTFGRPGELRRHMKKHNGPFFPCTHANCGKMFYRQDKLRDNLAKGH